MALDENSNSLKNIDYYFDEIPKNQELLTDLDNIYQLDIDFSRFNQISIDDINPCNLYDCFHGILNYIFYYSNSKLNTNEIEFHYSGSKNREDLETLNNKFKINYFDINNIFNYQDIESNFLINCYKNAFFGVSFKRIQINPFTYSIRSSLICSNLDSHLISFTFEGYNDESQKWEVLDEQHNINDLIPNGGFRMFFVRYTNKFYTSFKIKQTSPGSNDFWGFSISSFEIHGVISYKTDFMENEKLLLGENCNLKPKNESFDNCSFFTFDSTMDMTDYI